MIISIFWTLTKAQVHTSLLIQKPTRHLLTVVFMNIEKDCLNEVIDRSRFEKRWMLQAFCVNAELSDFGQFEGADFKKLVCQA